MPKSALADSTTPPPPGNALPPSLTEDKFLGGRLTVLQPDKGYRAGIDAVFVAASVPAAPKDKVFEAGIGVGVASLCLASRVPVLQITGMENAARYAMLAEENAKRNKCGKAIRVIQADIKDALRRDITHMPVHGSFAHAFANPPFFEDGTATPSPVALKAGAHNFGPDDLDLWVKVMHTLLEPRGTLTLIYRAEALGKVLATFEGRFGDIKISPLYARDGMPAARILVQGVKGSRAPLHLLPGLGLHREDGKFTPVAEAVLRDGAPWPLR